MRSGYTSSSAYYAGTKDQPQQGGAARAYPVAVSVSQKPSSASSPLLMHCSSNYSTVGISGASDPSSPLNGVPATPAACSPRGKQEPTVAVYGPSVPVQHPQFVDLATNMCSLMPFALTEDGAEEAREAYHTYPAESGRARQVSTDGSFLCDDGPAIPHSPPTAPTSTYTAHSHAVFPSQRAHLPPPQKPLQVPEEMPATAKARHSPVPSARRSLDATPQHQATTLHHDTNPSINHLIFVTNADGARICLSHPKGISPQELGSPNVSEMAGSPAEHATTMMGLTASTLSRRPVAPSREVREEEDEVFVSASQNAPQQLFSNESLDCSVELGMPQQQQQRRKELAERRKEPVRRGAAVAEPVEKATATTDDSARRPEREKTRRQRGSKRGEGSESAPAAAPSSRAARQNADGAVSSRRDVAPPSSPLGHDIGSPRRAYTVSVMGHRKAIAEVHSHASWGVGTYVMFDGDRGMDMGRVVSCVEEDPSAAEDRKEEAAEKGRHPNKTSSILREANEAERIAWTVEQPEEAAATLRVCREAATQLRLPLTVVDAVYQYNKQKLTFYYASNDRVDFRQLLQTLFLKFHCRIWMERVLPEEEEREVAV